jgi:CheY-like chemotaxis protein
MMPTPKDSHLVVLVDDDEMEHFFIEQYFEYSSNGYTLKTFHSGKDFISYMLEVASGKSQMPSIVLLDVRMPEWDGFRVLDELNKKLPTSRPPVVLMYSNSDAPSDVERARVAGANGYQTKPTGVKETDVFFKTIFKKFLEA